MQGYIKLLDIRFRYDLSFRYDETIKNFLIRYYFTQLRLTIINLLNKVVNTALANFFRTE
jgi:hypothetical protein